jgi:hypothetical protein
MTILITICLILYETRIKNIYININKRNDLKYIFKKFNIFFKFMLV